MADKAELDAICVDANNDPSLARANLAIARTHNNVGFLRLLLASLVIVGHAPEIIDGNRSREPLVGLFHTLSLGGVAVDGFFLISGYLISKSMLNRRSVGQYLTRRVLRIYPAFVVAFLLSVFIMAPLVGGRLGHPAQTLFALMTLKAPPTYSGQLTGLPYPALNGSMWTISYEFRCYILVALLGVTGLLANRRIMVALAVLFGLAAIAETFPQVRAWSDGVDLRYRLPLIFGQTYQTVTLTAIFFVGVVFYLFERRLVDELDSRIVILAALILPWALFEPHLASFALTTLGALILFWVAFRARLGPIGRINDRWDISYGTYLYGWPVATLLLWYNRGLQPWTLAALALPISYLAGGRELVGPGAVGEGSRTFKAAPDSGEADTARMNPDVSAGAGGARAAR